MHLPGRESFALMRAALFLLAGTGNVVRGQNSSDAKAFTNSLRMPESQTIESVGDHSLDLFADHKTFNAIRTISWTGIELEVDPNRSGLVELTSNARVTTPDILSPTAFSAGAMAPDGITALQNPGVTPLIGRDHRLEAGPGQNLTSIGQMYSTSRAQPAMLAINGGTILSINDQVSVLPPRGIIGVEAEGAGSRITAENITILALGLLRTGISGVEAVDGGLVTLEGGKIEILSKQSVGLLADNGTISTRGGLSITMAGLDSRGVEADGTGLVELGPKTSITTGGAGGIGILVSNGGTVIGNGISIMTTGILSSLSGFDADGATAQGGTINLENSSITTIGADANGLHALDANSRIFGTNLIIKTFGAAASGAEADNGGLIQLTGGTVITHGGGAFGLSATNHGEITAEGTSITTSGAGSSGLFVLNGGGINGNGLNVTAGGRDADGLAVSGTGSNITLTNSSILSLLGNAASVENGGTLNLYGSNVTALNHGIVATGGSVGAPNSITLSGGNLITVMGDAFQVQNGATNITVSDGATVRGNSALLRVLDPTTETVVNFTASHASLFGDIFADPVSKTTVNLTDGTVLTGRVNPAPAGLGGDLTIDGTSQWVMTGSSDLKSLSVSPGANAFFNPPSNGIYNTLRIGNLSGTGGIFGLNIDLRSVTGDLIDITGKSAGSHLLTFFDFGHGTDLPPGDALLVVKTSDGLAGFSGMTDKAVYKYFVVHGDGSSSTPIRNDWYLVRADEIVAGQVTRAAGAFPGSIDTPLGLSSVDALTNTANAAIGTYSASTPLFYADMDTLIQRLGELRFLAGIGRASVDSYGKEVIPETPTEQSPATFGTWVRGFGNGMHINDQVSRAYDQNTGGFQLGADKRFAAFQGDLYLGGFLSYFDASRDFLDGGQGSTNALSFGAYATWFNPKGWYADLVVKYSQLWNSFDTPLSGGSTSTGFYSIPSLGGSLEVGKRFKFGRFFVEPEAQLAGAWAAGYDYQATNGLMIRGSDQFSLRGQLGLRAGTHFTLSNGIEIEPYLKIAVLHEFLTGDRITLDETNFYPTLSGTLVDAAAGISAKLNQSVYLYGEYDYANGDNIREPWAVNAGVRWEWGGPGRDELRLVQNEVERSTGKEVEAKTVQPVPVKTTEPWEIKVGGPGWLANASGISGFHGFNQNISVDVGQVLRHINVIYAFNGEVRRGRFGVFGGLFYVNAQAGTPEGSGLVSKVDLGLQEFGGQLFGTYRFIDGPHGWLDLLVGFRDTYIGQQVGLQANNPAIDAASTQLVDGIAQRLTTGASDLGTVIKANIIDKLAALDNRNPVLPVGPVAEGLKAQISAAVQQLVQSREPGLAAAIRTKAQARVSQLKTQLATQIAHTLTSQLNRSFSFYDNWVDPLIGLRGRLNLTKAFYLTAWTDVGGFGVGSDIAVEAYAALGCQVTRNIYSEVGYHYLYDDFRDEGANDFLYQFSLHGVQISTGLNF
jgi:outer membrane autotransporter protein